MLFRDLEFDWNFIVTGCFEVLVNFKFHAFSFESVAISFQFSCFDRWLGLVRVTAVVNQTLTTLTAVRLTVACFTYHFVIGQLDPLVFTLIEGIVVATRTTINHLINHFNQLIRLTRQTVATLIVIEAIIATQVIVVASVSLRIVCVTQSNIGSANEYFVTKFFHSSSIVSTVDFIPLVALDHSVVLVGAID